jgi:hypothetical protein
MRVIAGVARLARAGPPSYAKRAKADKAAPERCREYMKQDVFLRFCHPSSPHRVPEGNLVPQKKCHKPELADAPGVLVFHRASRLGMPSRIYFTKGAEGVELTGGPGPGRVNWRFRAASLKSP